MKAIVQDKYGSPDVLELQDIDKPEVKDDEVLVRVRAASAKINYWDLPAGVRYILRLIAVGLRKPRNTVPGLDLAGQVEAVGKNVKRFQPSDEVFGWCTGAFAEYVSVSEYALALKPVNITFEQAAVVPVSAITALHGLRDKGQLQPGQHVLIIGASGGVGTFAVQIAKALGAEVTGVCSTGNLDLVRSIGGDHVIDYTQEDFTQSGQRYDLILDMAGDRSLSHLRRALSSKGTLVMVGGSGLSDQGYIRAIAHWLSARVLSSFVRQRLNALIETRSNWSKEDLVVLKELIEAGKVTPVISAYYPLREVPEAIRHFEEGHARGKVVITV
ncbi:MAG: NAD(P)-dependent alcohol dehydrogenase [Acidobacteria bacterium]|nr:NAD(P)-dependent alcohol dehydrogenase [Acidobacteriota bacterium]